jgi:hypothetical protein
VNATAGRAWFAALAAVVGASLVLQLVLMFTGPGIDPFGGDAPAGIGTRLLRFFSYFTIQSNLLVLAVALSLLRDPARDGRGWRVLQLDALLGIATTGVVFGTVLAGLLQLSGAAAWANAGLHYAAPAMAVLGWLLFGPRPRIDRRTLLPAMAWPAAWLAWTLLHGALTGWYPYPFLDAGKLGYPKALSAIGVVLLLALALAMLLRWLDARLPATRAR